MSAPQLVLITILGVIGVITVASWFHRSLDFDDDLWIEPAIMAVIGLFIYLIANV